jgi:hypothetical protein
MLCLLAGRLFCGGLAYQICCLIFGCCGADFKGCGSNFQAVFAAPISPSAGRLADHHHRRAHQATVERVAFLHHREHRVGLGVRVLDHAHGLVQLRIEGLALRDQSASIWNFRSASRSS